MDGTPVLVEGLLGDFVAEFENVRGRRPTRVYVTQEECIALRMSHRGRLLVFMSSPGEASEFMFDGAQVRRAKVAARIRAWDLTPF